MGNNTVYEWKTADDLFTWFQSHVSDDGWGYSELDELTLEKFNDHKYHASLKFGHYQADGTLIGNYKSLYIVIFRVVGGVLQAAQGADRNKRVPFKA